MSTSNGNGRRERVLPPSEHALALYRFLQTEWAAMDIPPTAWCRKVNIPDPTVLRWGRGVEPDLRNLKRVAEALGRSLLDILLAAGYVTPDEVGGHTIVERTPPSAREAIRQDPELSPVVKEATLQFLDGMQMVDGGNARRVKVEGRSGRTKSAVSPVKAAKKAPAAARSRSGRNA